MSRYVHGLTPTPRAIRYCRGKQDNLMLVPASLLPLKAQWQQHARQLSSGDALLIVPRYETPLKQTMRSLVPLLRAQGRHVTAVVAEREMGAFDDVNEVNDFPRFHKSVTGRLLEIARKSGVVVGAEPHRFERITSIARLLAVGIAGNPNRSPHDVMTQLDVGRN